MLPSQPSIPSPAPSDEPEGAAALIIGAPGEGKSYCLPTLIEAGLELFVQGTETRFTESLLDSMSDRKLDMKHLHYSKLEPMKASWDSLIQSAILINQLSFESLSGIKTGIGKEHYGQFIALYRSLSNFKCDHCGQSFGPVDKWGNNRALAIDGLSGVNMMALDLVVGSKPVRAMGEWGIAMDLEERLFHKLTSDTKCFFVLTAHLERDKDEITGGSSIGTGALGSKLGPRFPRFFSEVIHARRIGTEYWWSTATPMYTLKKRALPLSEKIPPTFVPLVQAWHKRLEQTKRQATL